MSGEEKNERWVNVCWMSGGGVSGGWVMKCSGCEALWRRV